MGISSLEIAVEASATRQNLLWQSGVSGLMRPAARARLSGLRPN
jgi:hypothetical protein